MADWIVGPDEGGRTLCNVVPSMLAAMGTPGFTDVLGLPSCRDAIVFLVDGLGWGLLNDYAADAPMLASLASRPPLTAGFPTTTATSIASLGTGMPAGRHGIMGYTFAEPSGGLLHPLGWRRHDGDRHNLLDEWPPEHAQPHESMFDRALDGGVRVHNISPSHFDGTGLTRAALRGAEFVGVRAEGDLLAELLARVGADEPTLCYGYHSHLDLLGHLHGPGSLPWRLQLSRIDSLLGMLVEQLPPAVTLAVVADHGMVTIDPAAKVDADREPALLEGVRLLGGEARARHVYTRTGARADVHAAWEERLGERGVVVTAEEAIDAGWFGTVDGSVRERIGDLIAVVRDGGVVRSELEPMETALVGQHGSLTAAEQYIPLLVARGS